MENKKVMILFIIWMCLSVALAFSVIGLLLFIPRDYDVSTWCGIGKKLLNENLR
jgi:hypothetical protein